MADSDVGNRGYPPPTSSIFNLWNRHASAKFPAVLTEEGGMKFPCAVNLRNAVKCPNSAWGTHGPAQSRTNE